MIRFLFISLLLCCAALPVRAGDIASSSMAFRALPVLHEGRIKPLESAARSELARLGDGALVNSNAAVDQLAALMFDPGTAGAAPLIRIRSAELRQRLELADTPGHVYALPDLAAAFARRGDMAQDLLRVEADKLSPAQQEFLRAYDAMIGLTQILRTLTMILPLDVTLSPELRGRYGMEDQPAVTYLDFKRFDDALARDLAALVRRKGDDPRRYSGAEQEQALLSFHIRTLEQAGQHNDFMRLMPPQWDAGGEWLSPWQVLLAGGGAPQLMPYFNDWQDMARHWRAGDRAGFDRAAQAALDRVTTLSNIQPARFYLEVAYKMLQPHIVSAVMYALAVALAFLFMLKIRFHHHFYTGAWVCAAVGFAVHAASLVARIVILERPPVGTLYESVLFVGCVCVAVALAMEMRLRGARFLLLAGLAGLILQIVGMAFAQDGDTLGTLTAVLNTNFWLGTHVLTITAGYALSLLSGLYAYVLVLGRAQPQGTGVGVLIALCAASLLLTSAGTLLGGVWADQSWGRFWGWDPKENGALCLVLWLAWCLHGRVSRVFDDRALALALTLTPMVVALAWFGVNLLNAGLHSYGFVSGVAGGLAVFCILQLCATGFLIVRDRRA